MKATDQYLCTVQFESNEEIVKNQQLKRKLRSSTLLWYHILQAQCTGPLHVLTYGSVREIPQCDNSNESYLKVSIFPIMQEWDGTMCDPKTKVGFEVQHYSNSPLA